MPLSQKRSRCDSRLFIWLFANSVSTKKIIFVAFPSQVMEFVKKMTGREYVGFSNATYVFRFGVLHLFRTQFHCYWLTFDFRLDRFQSEKETGDRNYAIGYYLKEKKVCTSANSLLYKQTGRMLLMFSNTTVMSFFTVFSGWGGYDWCAGLLFPGWSGDSSPVLIS